jgi:hypothetical protein
MKQHQTKKVRYPQPRSLLSDVVICTFWPDAEFSRSFLPLVLINSNTNDFSVPNETLWFVSIDPSHKSEVRAPLLLPSR